MFLENTIVDFSVLPTGLLPEAKQQMRVEFARDDEFIKGCIARAIAEVEAVTDLTIAPSTWIWKVDACDCQSNHYGYWRVPKTPVQTVSAVDAAGLQTPVEVYWIEGTAYITGTVGGQYVIEAGYPTKAQMPPAVLNPILLIAATLYETRESMQFGSIHEIPDMARRLMSGLWRPSV